MLSISARDRELRNLRSQPIPCTSCCYERLLIMSSWGLSPCITKTRTTTTFTSGNQGLPNREEGSTRSRLEQTKSLASLYPLVVMAEVAQIHRSSRARARPQDFHLHVCGSCFSKWSTRLSARPGQRHDRVALRLTLDDGRLLPQQRSSRSFFEKSSNHCT